MPVPGGADVSRVAVVEPERKGRALPWVIAAFSGGVALTVLLLSTSSGDGASGDADVSAGDSVAATGSASAAEPALDAVEVAADTASGGNEGDAGAEEKAQAAPERKREDSSARKKTPAPPQGETRGELDAAAKAAADVKGRVEQFERELNKRGKKGRGKSGKGGKGKSK